MHRRGVGEPAMSKIFLNYRREDSAAFAGRLHDHLVEHFGPDAVFIDIDRIDLGVDFIDAINEKIGLCQVLLVLIGRQWLTSSDAAGRRLDNPNDFVRLEIAAANARNVRIIPVLVEGAAMPREEQLPQELKFLARRNATELSYVRFRDDVNHLIQAISRIVTSEPASPPLTSAPVPAARDGKVRKRGRLIYGAAAVVVAGVIWIGSSSGFFRRMFGTRTEPVPAPAGASGSPSGPASPGAAGSPSKSEPPSKSPSGSTRMPLTKRVPSVLHLPYEAAETELHREGFQVVATKRRSSIREGTVLDQFPHPDNQAKAGSTVRLTVAEPLRVPNIKGMTVERAESLLRAAGFSMDPGKPDLVAGFSGPDTVESQNPFPGTAVSNAGPVKVIVKKAAVVVPSLKNLFRDQARAELSKAGLAEGDVTARPSNAVPGTVVEQSPNSGSLAAKGASVDFVITANAQKKQPAAPANRVTIDSVTCRGPIHDERGSGQGVYVLRVNGTVTSLPEPHSLIVTANGFTLTGSESVTTKGVTVKSSLKCGTWELHPGAIPS
jgi:beta-lactam-binding protein with PASTA domain